MPAKRVLISIDQRLLARVDDACERRGFTRSGYLARLAAADLEGEGANAVADASSTTAPPIRNKIGYE